MDHQALYKAASDSLPVNRSRSSFKASQEMILSYLFLVLFSVGALAFPADDPFPESGPVLGRPEKPLNGANGSKSKEEPVGTPPGEPGTGDEKPNDSSEQKDKDPEQPATTRIPEKSWEEIENNQPTTQGRQSQSASKEHTQKPIQNGQAGGKSSNEAESNSKSKEKPEAKPGLPGPDAPKTPLVESNGNSASKEKPEKAPERTVSPLGVVKEAEFSIPVALSGFRRALSRLRFHSPFAVANSNPATDDNAQSIPNPPGFFDFFGHGAVTPEPTEIPQRPHHSPKPKPRPTPRPHWGGYPDNGGHPHPPVGGYDKYPPPGHNPDGHHPCTLTPHPYGNMNHNGGWNHNGYPNRPNGYGPGWGAAGNWNNPGPVRPVYPRPNDGPQPGLWNGPYNVPDHEYGVGGQGVQVDPPRSGSSEADEGVSGTDQEPTAPLTPF